MLTVLRRHFPQLAPALAGVEERVPALEGDQGAGCHVLRRRCVGSSSEHADAAAPAWAHWSTITGKVSDRSSLWRPIAFVALWVARLDEHATARSTYDDITEHFKYGSIGSEPGGSLLRPVGGCAAAVLDVQGASLHLPEKLPGGLRIGRSPHRARQGSADRHLAAAGVSASIRSDSTAPSAIPAPCATRPSAPPRIVLGMPAHQLDLQALVSFVLECSLDNRLTRENVLARVARDGRRRSVAVRARCCCASVLLDRLKTQVLESPKPHRAGAERSCAALGARPRRHIQSVQVASVQLAARSAAAIRTDWRGGLSVARGTRRRAKACNLHWDGDNDSVDERNLSAALGAGVTPVTVDHAAMKRVRDWIWTLPPPKYPYPIDQTLAAAERRCTRRTA